MYYAKSTEPNKYKGILIEPSHNYFCKDIVAFILLKSLKHITAVIKDTFIFTKSLS